MNRSAALILSCLLACLLACSLAAVEVPLDRFYPQEAVLVPLSERSQIQTKLDQHGVIRLETGDYMPNNSLRSITLRSGQRIYGLSSVIPDLTVEAGAQDVLLSYVHGKITFPASALVTRRAQFRRVTYSNYQAVGATLEDCLFLCPATCFYNIDNRSGGWWRNNRFIRYLSHGGDPAFQIRGDAAGNSYGNVMLWANSLTPPSSLFVFENQGDFNLIHLDVEGYSTAGKPAVQLDSVGMMTVFSTTGHIPTGRTVDANARGLWLHGHTMGFNESPGVVLRPGNQVSLIVNSNTNVTTPSDLASEPKIRAQGFVNSGADKSLIVEGVTHPTTAIADDAETALDNLVSTARTGLQWERPTFVTPPNPTVADPATQPSSTDSIQAQLNSRGVVLLPEGVFYLDRPLVFSRGMGLIGAGMNKTILVARNQNTDLIVNGTTAGLTLADLTLKGGRNGINLKRTGGEQLQYNELSFSHVTIRDMRDHGLVFEEIYGFDNNYIDFVNFVNCGTAIRQIAVTKTDPQHVGITYMDKCVFYQCQFIGCGKALDLLAARASGGNMWANCLFKDNTVYAARGVHHSPMTFANCDFINNKGHPVVNTDGNLVLIACVFQAGAANPTSLIDAINVTVEGCRFESAGATTTKVIAEPPTWITVNFANSGDANTIAYVNRNLIFYNTTSQLSVGDLRTGLLFNTTFPEGQYTTRGAHVLNRVATTFIGGSPDSSPKSQLLVGTQLPPSMTSETGQAPKINSETNVNNATVGSAFAYAITALNFPTSFSTTGLPGWLTLNSSTGILTGTPPTAGAVTFSVTATNVFGSDSRSVTITVSAATINAPVISGTVSLTAYLDTQFSHQVVASNNPTSYNASSLPPGLTINTGSGVISGKPTEIGTRTSSVVANNTIGSTFSSLVFRVLPKIQTPIVPIPSSPPSNWTSSDGGGGGCSFGGAAAGILLGFLLLALRRQRFQV